MTSSDDQSTKPNISSARARLAAAIVIIGIGWTSLTGACTGFFGLFTMGIALIFGAPLVIGGGAVWIAGDLLRRDANEPAVRQKASLWAGASALAFVAGIWLAVACIRTPDEYGLGQILGLFAAAGSVGVFVLLASSAWLIWKAHKTDSSGSE